MSKGFKKREVHWGSKTKKSMRPVQMKPQIVYCEPETEEEKTEEAKRHSFYANKVYVFTDETGVDEPYGVCICPKHEQPVRVKLIKRRKPP